MDLNKQTWEEIFINELSNCFNDAQTLQKAFNFSLIHKQFSWAYLFGENLLDYPKARAHKNLIMYAYKQAEKSNQQPTIILQEPLLNSLWDELAAKVVKAYLAYQHCYYRLSVALAGCEDVQLKNEITGLLMIAENTKQVIHYEQVHLITSLLNYAQSAIMGNLIQKPDLSAFDKADEQTRKYLIGCIIASIICTCLAILTMALFAQGLIAASLFIGLAAGFSILIATSITFIGHYADELNSDDNHLYQAASSLFKMVEEKNSLPDEKPLIEELEVPLDTSLTPANSERYFN